MQRKFFIRRFWKFFLILIIPTVLTFLIAFTVVNQQVESSLDNRAKNTLSNINTNLDFVISNLVFQNDQLTNNPYMVLSLKNLLQRNENIAYSDAIYLRNLKAMLNSIIQSYPYIRSVELCLDGYDSYFSSETGVTKISDNEELQWWQEYYAQNPDLTNALKSEMAVTNSQSGEALTIYQRMLLLEGAVVMTLDVEQYRSLLDDILVKDYETVFYIDEGNRTLFSWNDRYGLTDVFDLNAVHEVGAEGGWISIAGNSYLLHTAYNDQYNLHLVSLISSEAKTESFMQILKLFALIFVVDSIVIVSLAYMTTKRTFDQLYYMIQVFHDAESGIYPVQPRHEMKDEYDVIMNNIIYLFLRTVKLKGDLVERQHEQEVAELKALQLQINPHFLFNTLQTMQLEIQRSADSTGEVVKMLGYLADILKYALADPLEMICLKDEIDYLKKYVAIQKIRFGDQFIIYYEIDEGLQDFQVFRLMLQPLVENSILHGVRRIDRRGYIKVQIFRRGDHVHFRVVDNGEGMTRKECGALRESLKKKQNGHIGLANVNSRLILYFGEAAGIRIRSKKGMGCVMEFAIPYHLDQIQQNHNS